jgi:putative salt-induced outer membrane protein
MKLGLILLLLPVIAIAETKFKNNSEVTIIETGGNSSVETYNGKTLSTWEKEKRSYSLGGHYTLGYNEVTDTNTGDKEKVESVRNWDVNVRYEQILSKRFSGFSILQYEGDEFAGYKQRENVDLGAKYLITKTDKLNSFAELGARYTIEKTTQRNDDNEDVFNFTKGRLFYEVSYKQSESLSYKFWAEYLPNFTKSEDYIISYEPSVAFVLSKTFSLKTAYKSVYDNEPNIEGGESTDYTFTTSLLASFD